MGPQTAKRRAGAPSVLHFFLCSLTNDVEVLRFTYKGLKSAPTDWVCPIAPSRPMVKGSPLHRTWNYRCAVMPVEPRGVIYKAKATLGGKRFQTTDTCGKNTKKTPLFNDIF